jgi:hypothetical protein
MRPLLPVIRILTLLLLPDTGVVEARLGEARMDVAAGCR